MNKLIKKKKYVNFINKINIVTMNKVQNKNFAQGPQIFQDGLPVGKVCILEFVVLRGQSHFAETLLLSLEAGVILLQWVKYFH